MILHPAVTLLVARRAAVLAWVSARHAPMRARSSAAVWVASVAAAVLTVCGSLAQAAPDGPARVHIDSLEPGVRVPAYWFPAPAPGGAAVVALHGCAGPDVRDGRPGEFMLRYARLLNEAGIGVVFTESFEPRGRTSICSQKPSERSITEAHRRLDALGALSWLAAQPGIDARRLGVLGWSHGGQTVLWAADAASPAVSQAAVRPAALVAFYPGCSALEKSPGFTPAAPLLVMSGALDDWTAAAPCRRLVQRLAARDGTPPVAFIEFPGSHHGFDRAHPPREVRNVGSTPSGRAMLGGNPQAREASAQELLRFLRAHLAP
jgi:dienelactone hydrolase